MKRMLQQAMSATALLAVAVLVGVTGLGFLFAALYLALVEVIPPAGAAIATGVVALLLALVLALQARSAIAPRPKPRDGADAEAGSADTAVLASQLGRLLGESTSQSLRTNAPRAALIALAAGFAVGVSPRLRRSLLKLLR